MPHPLAARPTAVAHRGRVLAPLVGVLALVVALFAMTAPAGAKATHTTKPPAGKPAPPAYAPQDKPADKPAAKPPAQKPDDEAGKPKDEDKNEGKPKDDENHGQLGCDASKLTAGAVVGEAELKATAGGLVFEKIELVG